MHFDDVPRIEDLHSLLDIDDFHEMDVHSCLSSRFGGTDVSYFTLGNSPREPWALAALKSQIGRPSRVLHLNRRPIELSGKGQQLAFSQVMFVHRD